MKATMLSEHCYGRLICLCVAQNQPKGVWLTAPGGMDWTPGRRDSVKRLEL